MKLFKNKTFIYILSFILCGIIAFVIYEFLIDSKDKNLDEGSSVIDDSNIMDRKGSLNALEDGRSIKVSIGDIVYDMVLEENQSVNDLVALCDFSINMNSKDDNQLYGYLQNSISFSPTYCGLLNKGDVLLSESNCLTILFDDIETDVSYVKVGHIDNLPELDYWDIVVSFSIN